jgi:hypothetical protein
MGLRLESLILFPKELLEMTVMLDRLKYRSLWVTRLGALKGCADYLGGTDSAAWWFGATGHAFILNMSADACSASPTAWNCEMITHLAHNLGVGIRVLNAWKTENDFPLKQRIAWENTKRALDKGLPCYGWELGIPEFYVICGYDEYGYYYKGIGTPTLRFAVESEAYGNLWQGQFGENWRQVFESHDIPLSGEVSVAIPMPGYAVVKQSGSSDEFHIFPNGKGQLEIHDDFTRPSEGFKPWEELGNSNIGWLHTGWLEHGAASDDHTTVAEALEFALEFAGSPSKWVMPGYKAGLDGYDNWLKALQNVSSTAADPTGLAYNGEVWAECRGHAEQFLKEASDRIGGQAGKLLLLAAGPYGEAAAQLGLYRTNLPFFGRTPELLQEKKDMLMVAVRGARAAEEKGLQLLRDAYGSLERS